MDPNTLTLTILQLLRDGNSIKLHTTLKCEHCILFHLCNFSDYLILNRTNLYLLVPPTIIVKSSNLMGLSQFNYSLMTIVQPFLQELGYFLTLISTLKIFLVKQALRNIYIPREVTFHQLSKACN